MDNLKKEELSVKSFTIKNNNDSSVSLYNNIDNNTTNQQSKDNQNLNEKIVKLFIGNHPLISMTTIKKITHFNFTNKYLKNELYYNSIIIDHIIHNDPGHIVAEFKDFLIMGDINEFLQNSYKLKESLYLLPKIYEYYISCSVIFPNYVILPESQYIYKNIQRKQRVIDVQQEQEDKEENIKKGLIKNEKLKEECVFDTQVLDSILNQTDTSGIKQYFGVTTEGNSLGGQLSKIIEGITFYEQNKMSYLKPKYNNCLYKNKNLDLSNSFFKNKKEENNNDNLKKSENINHKQTYIANNNNNEFTKNKKINSDLNNNNIINSNIIQSSNSTKVINETSVNHLNNDNILNNGISLKNIISRNKRFNKSKNKETKKERTIKGRNCLQNINQDNYNNFYTTTNSNGGGNITLSSKCNTSRYKYNKEKINDVLDKPIKINSSKKRNQKNSNNVVNPKSLNIIKKSLINSLLNSNKGIEIGNQIKKSNSRSILNTNKEMSKISMNGTLFDSIAKNSLNNSKNKFQKENFYIKNRNEKKNNESEYLYYRNKHSHNHHLFSGFSGREKNVIYQRKKNDDISYYYNKNKLSNNSSIKNIKIGNKTKNYSSNNILGYKNALSTSNISGSIKNKFTYKKNQRIINKIKNSHTKDINGNNIDKKETTISNIITKKKSEILMNKNEIENKNDNFNISNGIDNNMANKNKETVNNKNKHSKNDKLIKRNEYKGINSYKYKNKNTYKINPNHNKKNSTQFINLDRKMEKKISEKKLRNTFILNSPKNSLSNKRYLMKSDLREKKVKDNNERPLTVRESLNNINNEAIEILTNKINKIKQYIKESDQKDVNSISHIFQKKKINRKNVVSSQNIFSKEESNGIQLSDRTRNKYNTNKANNTINNIENNFGEKKIKSIFINNNYKYKNDNNNLEKQKRMSNDDNNINNNIIIKNNKDNKKNEINNNNNKKHYKYSSNVNINNGINFSERNNNNLNKNNEKIKNQNKDSNENIKINNNNNLIKKNNETEKNIILMNNDIKSSSLKVLPIKQLNQNKIIVKGIKINGFEKVISKKYNTRNIDIPKAVTDRIKIINGANVVNNNTNRYINTSNNRKTNIKKNENKIA